MILNEDEIRQQIQFEQGRAAQRTFEILTEWLRSNPSKAFVLDIGDDGVLQLELSARPEQPHILSRGESLQDACAQAAQVIHFNHGDL